MPPILKRELNCPIVVTLQGDDIFLDSLPADLRSRAIALMHELEPHVDAFLTNSRYYAEHMQRMLGLPAAKFRLTPLGLHGDDLQHEARPPAAAGVQPRVLGYLARLAPEKGLADLVDAFIKLKQQPATADVHLHLAGWLGEEHRPFAEQQFQRLRDAGWGDDFRYHGEVDRSGKREFLRGIDVLSVPSRYRDPKGLYVLEAAAAGVPVVQPSHGAFPEVLERIQCGLLSVPGDVDDLTAKLTELLTDDELRLRLGAQGRRNVLERHNERTMAEDTWRVLREFL